jgi:putative ABC transport system permease protein
MNLATARSARRAQEIGMRKVLGAVKGGLVRQFLCESFFYSCFSLFLAIGLTELALPAMSSIAGYELSLDFLNMPWLLPALLGITLFVGLAAGSYPAFYLAAFQPVRVLKGGVRTAKKNTLFRSVLVVLQFAASVTLIIGTVIIVRQLSYMKNKNPGFNKEQVVVLPFRDEELRRSLSTIKTELKGYSGIVNVSISSDIPGQYPQLNSKYPEGFPLNQPPLMYDLNVDADFIRTMGMEIIAGRDFSQKFGADQQAAIINEAAAKQFGWDNPIGKRIGGYGGIKTVIGVVRDYHQLPLTQEIKPLFIRISPEDKYNPYRMLSVKIAPGNISRTLNFVETKWNEVYPNHPFDYFFLDESFGEQFQEIERTKKLTSYFAGLAIFIACLGLYGLASFMAEQRTKEIGIRKVLGATTSGIVCLISKELAKMVALANAIAWPVAYLLMRNWLTSFPYRVNITLLTFLLSGAVVLIIGLATVSYQSIKAGLSDPVDSLKYE